MDPEVEEIIKRQIRKLPIEIRKIVADPKLGEKITSMGVKNGLNAEQLEILQREVVLVVLGLVHPDELADGLINHSKINGLRIDNIITDIDREILSGIKEKLKKVYNTPDTEEVETGLDERFGKLAPEVQNAILASNFQAKLYAIATTHKLTTAQLGELETAMTQVILDIIPPHKFEGVLKASLDLPEEKVTALAGEVNEKILKDIRAKMLIRYNLDKPVNLEREEHEVLKRAGIEVLTDPVLDDQELLAGPVYPELARKFTEPTKTETKKTEHTLENLTPTSAPLPPSAKEKPKVDPYREPIE